MSGEAYDCPKCGGPADMIEGKDTIIRCPSCGDTRIVLSIRTNGDILTLVEGTDTPYELDPAVRSARKALDAVPEGDIGALVDARNALAGAYAESGREVEGELLVRESLDLLKDAFSDSVSRYCNQVSLSAYYAQVRGSNADAIRIYEDALKMLGHMDDDAVAVLKIKRSLLWTRADADAAKRHLEEALEILDHCEASDPYAKVAAYEALRTISVQNGDRESASKYLDLELDERLNLLDSDTPASRVAELADSMGRKAEELANAGDKDGAMKILTDAAELTVDVPQANAYAVMNLARYQQSTGSVPEDFAERMDAVIEALADGQDKRTRETLAQAYMFRSMSRDAEDYDGLTKDIGESYSILMDLAYKGDVNEMFLMSAARSYLVLLNMKDQEKARAVRAELAEIGISQMDLDRSSRSSMGNAGKSTRVDIAPRPEKPLPGRRLKRNIKGKQSE